ncbi:MAG: hypothetical protein AB3N10_19065 [Allomuricauda sp.]
MLNKILGVILILISLGIIANLIPGTIALLGMLGEAFSQNTGGIWGAFTASLLIQAVGWIIAYFMFRTGRRLFKSTV